MENDTLFVEEIHFKELQFLEVVGRGAFGVVSRARWRNIDVAVKLIETDAEKKAFITELKQLSRVDHPNIVKLYGACTQPPSPVCLVMEYAEGGSLYNVLHGESIYIEYTGAHAISWLLQCAQGVEYLHGMKPKPLIHRDLKPPNLLLVQGGTVLKICDFGTACDAHTYMTNNKGSAAWMAPEVFEGSNYSEKCDVFSFGIILWEVITRRKPFDEIGGPAFRIMWAVHNGTRPPLIKGIPKPLETLMTRCWSANSVERPHITEVVKVISTLAQFFPGADVPLVFPKGQEEELLPASSVYYTPPPTNMSSHHATVKQMGEIVQIPSTPKAKPVVVQEETRRRTSAPPSLAASRENLIDKSSRSSTPSIDLANKRFSADLTKLDELDIAKYGNQPVAQSKKVFGHRRTGSHGNPFVNTGNQGNIVSHHAPVRTHRRTGSHGNTPFNPADLVQVAPSSGSNEPTHPLVKHTVTAPGSLGMLNAAVAPEQPGSGDTFGIPNRSVSWTPGFPLDVVSTLPEVNTNLITDPAENMAFLAMDRQLQPLAPCPTSQESMQIFEKHCEVAREYLRMQTEIALLSKRKDELQRLLEEEDTQNSNDNNFIREYRQLMSENEALALLHKNLKQQVDLLRAPRSQTSRTEA